MTEPTVNEAAFWQGLYERQGDRWELGGPAPPLVHYLATHPRLPGEPVGSGGPEAEGRRRGEQINVAVPGCGRGHDARLLARQGYRVRAFDFAEPAIRAARALAAEARVEVAFEQRDVFDLAADYRGAFDGLWEYTCFCAIDPARRPEYVALVHALLKPGGWLLACFFPIGERPPEGRDGPRRPGDPKIGPPFATTEAEVRRLFEPRFDFEETYVPPTSADGRQGREWLVLARATA